MVAGTLGGSFHFTIENDELADEALKYLENQAEVILQYRAELVSSITRSQESSPNFVIKIVELENINRNIPRLDILSCNIIIY